MSPPSSFGMMRQCKVAVPAIQKENINRALLHFSARNIFFGKLKEISTTFHKLVNEKSAMQLQQSKLSSRYHRSTLSTPLFHFLIKPFLPILQPALDFAYWFRWQLCRPLKTKVFPKWIPRFDLLGNNMIEINYGEMFLLSPHVALLIAGYYFCFYSPDVESSGHVASYAIILSFLAANKSSSVFSFAFGIPFERLLGCHKLAALCAIAIGTCHTYLVFSTEEGHDNVIQFAFRDVNNALGSLILLCLAGLVMTSIFPILRRWNYDVWLYIHIGLAVAIALPWSIHSVNLVWIPLFWFAVDWLARYGVMASCRYNKKACIRQIHADVVEIRFPKPNGFDYNAGQFLRIAIPRLSAFQFHPFSISSAPHEADVTLHIRALGNWTEQLLELAKEQPGSHHVWIEGPYGALSVDLNGPRYGMILLVSGGIGVTPCRSVLRSLVRDHELGEHYSETIRLVWTVRDLDLVKSLSLLQDAHPSACVYKATDIQPLESQSDSDEGENSSSSSSASKSDGCSIVQTEVYVTGQKKKNMDEESCECFGDAGLQVVVHPGRPDLGMILSKIAEEAVCKKITHIAVLGCGPQAMIRELKEKCRHHSKTVTECKGVTFDLHEEVFQF